MIKYPNQYSFNRRNFLKTRIEKFIEDRKIPTVQTSINRSGTNFELYKSYVHKTSDVLTPEIYAKSIFYDIDSCIYDYPERYVNLVCYTDLKNDSIYENIVNLTTDESVSMPTSKISFEEYCDMLELKKVGIDSNGVVCDIINLYSPDEFKII